MDPDTFFGSGVPAALRSFRYKAGAYEVSVGDAAGFGAGSDVLITFTSIHAIDVNVVAPGLFPELGGGAVGFHADFNAFGTAPVLMNDGLPTDAAGLSAGSFDESVATLLPPRGVVSGGVTSFAVRAVPEAGVGVMGLVVVVVVVGVGRRVRVAGP